MSDNNIEIKEDICTICFSDNMIQKTNIAGCAHTFCYKCIKLWIERQVDDSKPNMTCPSCPNIFDKLHTNFKPTGEYDVESIITTATSKSTELKNAIILIKILYSQAIPVDLANNSMFMNTFNTINRDPEINLYKDKMQDPTENQMEHFAQLVLTQYNNKNNKCNNNNNNNNNNCYYPINNNGNNGNNRFIRITNDRNELVFAINL
jgi:hypothetical protein